MYRLTGFGSADCTVPSECVQAVKNYPQYMNKSLVDDYCVWEAQGKGGAVETLCLEAIMKGQAQETPPANAECASDADCSHGLCEHGVCYSLPITEEQPTKPWVMVVVGIGIVGALIYYFARSAG